MLETMARTFEVRMRGSMIVEWTTTVPNNNCSFQGPPFYVESIQCYLIFSYKYASEYDLSLQVCKPSTSSFHAKACLSVGTDLFLSETTDGIQGKALYLIWRSKRSELSKMDPNFLVNDRWHFRVDICKEHTEDKSMQTPIYSDENFGIQSLSEDLSKLLDQDSSADVQLKCGGGVTFKAHRILLSARSEVFRSMLGSDMTEARTGVVQIQDVEADLFRQFLRYLYTGTLEELTLDRAMRLYEVADKYRAEVLMKQCTSFLVENLRKDNACAILSLAERHSDGQLKEDATAYILDQKIPLRKDDPDWCNFADSHPALAMQMLTRLCTLQVSSSE